MNRSWATLAIGVAWAATANPCPAQVAADATPEPPAQSVPDDSLVLLSVDVRTLPAYTAKTSSPPPPQWRTSFGSERRSEPVREKAASVEADIVLLQGVTDVPALRRWFPAGQWRLVVSRQVRLALADAASDAAQPPAAPVPTTAVAVRLRRGLRLTGQAHLTELAGVPRQGTDEPAAAGTAVRVLIDGRQTWAVSVLLPENCRDDCPGRAIWERWRLQREQENIRVVTGGRFAKVDQEGPGCPAFGLRLDPPPPPPRQAYVSATGTPLLGCAASATVAK